ncbi:DNA polymerase III subunit gamma/tau [Providencia rettgeri]|uniref:DNA polymerase III subunit gamma/tau n=1 Tax=Providencia rettgeri TaxID=587 RepID=UPI001B35CD57|nr:DNA polymerase III subunit gamma/tau [Providencia rettgeri]EHZ7763846.1 DNA polymerase III subunit gamma/tau [Providencia rettgeri]EIJ7166988.1 DNA polymerase III subunit gamma/tau [Providencia rettgeri]EJD6046511.1 DNA polymerase III subunit gamma/tau [Providencia rettgeri]EJD6049529.1 DNA polymerase III subunit gamma/tau [Providencia rettgeri]ELR5091267.1 DNA polymerase III subunit gamma/tau [Providencia rettgeri]
MSYQVLARKWRPQKFSDVVGQQHVLTALANGLTHQRLHHAYLFSGTRGVGKTTIARLFAKGLNCETGITASPCGQCANCLEIEQGRFVDLIEIDAASRTKVEDTRELLDNVQYAPARGRFKVYLIDEVHMLSRHSFNALLKTLEEPPEHVKFLLATTDPQKLPVTILSRCLQFHLKALDVTQISEQLELILNAENIEHDQRARQLIARAADGSLRDALSLTDQAIAMGQGKVTADIVSQMLGTLDDEQPLAIIEALVRADSMAVMEQVEQAASRGADWENLLVEILSQLHRIAMIQLLPAEQETDPSSTEGRLRQVARVISPADLQLFYQTLLVGRKELPYAPERRMGVEMALLRALAFHPKNVIAEIEAPLQVIPQAAVQSAPSAALNMSQRVPPTQVRAENLPDNSPTLQLLKARQALQSPQSEDPSPKKAKPVMPERAKPAASALERLAAVTSKHQQNVENRAAQAAKPQKPKQYQWKPQNEESMAPKEAVTTPSGIKEALEYEKTPELAVKIIEEGRIRDSWSGKIAKLNIPKLVEQLALNSYIEELSDSQIILHLRSAQKHLDKPSAHKVLEEALSEQYGRTVELKIVHDDNSEVKTPLEWRQAIYEEKLAQARQSIIADKTIQKLRSMFDAQLDEESIRPV